MGTDATQEHLLIGCPGNIHVIAIAVPRFSSDMDTRCQPEPEQHPRYIIRKTPAGCSVVNTAATTARIDLDRSIRCPQVSEEERYLLLRQRKDRLGDVLLVAALIEEAEFIKPFRKRVANPVRNGTKAGETQRRAAGCGVLVCADTHFECARRCLCHDGLVSGVLGCVPNGLASNH